MASSVYYINGKQQFNSDVSFNNQNTQIDCSNIVTIKGNSVKLIGYTTINGSAPITLNTDNVWTGKQYFPVDASFDNVFISSSATTATMTDKFLTIDSNNRVVSLDLSASSSTSVALGGHSLMANKTANNSTAIGYNAMQYISSYQPTNYNNTAVGYEAMKGSAIQAIMGTDNTAIGTNSLKNILSGVGNVAIGSSALSTLTTGASNTVVGAFSDVDSNSISTNQIFGSGNISNYSNVNIIGSGIEANGSGRTFISPLRNITNIDANNIATYNPLSNEVSYCNDMIQKALNSTQFISQQGVKLVAVDYLGQSKQGSSIAITSDGNTLAIGAPDDNGGIGAVWVWKKVGNVWTEQQKLVASDYISSVLPIKQGCSVAFSTNDGNTIAVGGSGDNGGMGAVWIWTRQDASSPYNPQQKIIGTGATGSSPRMGSSVSLSGNGNQLVFGGMYDNNDKGKAWIWTRVALGQNYTQTAIITGSDSTASSWFGNAVAMSNDGTTIAVGGYQDNSFTGATWIFFNGFSGWAQQGSKLVGVSTSLTTMTQGKSVAISNDGNIVAVGGSNDNNSNGAVWVWNRSGSTWTQYGNKLVGSNTVGTTVFQGTSLSMTGDGNTIAFGGNYDKIGYGAVWVFSKNGGTTYTQQGDKIVGAGNISVGGINSNQGSSVAISNDGSSLFLGGNADNANIGAVWFFPKTTNNVYVGNNNTSMTIGSTLAKSQLIAQIIQNSKIVAQDNCGNSQQGYSVAISPDGNTMAIGAPGDNGNTGAVWIWTAATGQPLQKIVGPSIGSYFGSSLAFSGSLDGAYGRTLAIGGWGDNTRGAVWIYTSAAYMTSYSIQGTKIVPSDLSGNNNQVGYSVALSSNGNRLAIGGPGDAYGKGSTWIWNRSGSTWSQSGLRRFGSTDSAQPSGQGTSVALSGDGNTLAIGGPGDNNGFGAVWVFIYSGSGTVWNAIQTKLVDNDNSAISNQGDCLSLSNDGNTLVYGSPADNGIGSVSIFTRANSSSTYLKLQKLIGTNYSGINNNQGSSVAISSDGLTIIVGAMSDNNGAGASWVWTRTTSTSSSVFYQYGPKILGSGSIGNSQQGYSVAISGSGNVMAVGGWYDNTTYSSTGIGAVWMFSKNAASISVGGNQQFMGVGTVTPTAPLTVSCNNGNQGIATGSSCVDIYNYEIGGAFQRYFSNNQSKSWWHVGSEVGDGAQSFPFHIFNQDGTGMYMNSGDQSWSGYSDRRLKTNIEDIDISGAYQSILKLNPVTYKLMTSMNDKDQMKQGLIAQDVMNIFPQIVSMNHGLYGIGYTELIPYLIAGMKQQAVIISQQNEKILAFEERLAALEKKSSQ